MEFRVRESASNFKKKVRAHRSSSGTPNSQHEHYLQDSTAPGTRPHTNPDRKLMILGRTPKNPKKHKQVFNNIVYVNHELRGFFKLELSNDMKTLKNYSLIEIKGKNLPHSLINNRHNLKSIA